jgi:glutathione S-transferase
MDALEGVLSRTSYLAGERFTAADVYTGSAIVWNVHFGAFEARPVFSDYIARVTERDAFRRAAALDDAEAERMGHPPQG